ncbi:MAG TPA: hypothetical protein VF591_00160 [Pyrinomonadaceae bacterium]|jgi:hypothetical protein
MRNLSRLSLILCALLALLSASTPLPPRASAQETNTGLIRGRIVLIPSTLDQAQTKVVNRSGSRQPVANAQVTVVDTADGRTVLNKFTNDEGYFQTGPLRPGRTYQIVVFGNNIIEEKVNVYTLGEVEVTIEVSKVPGVNDPYPLQPPTVRILTQRRNLTDARRDGAYIAKTVNEVSLGGSSLTRSYDELAFYLPGIAAPPQTLSNSPGPGFGAGIGTSGQFSSNGLRSRANNFTVDGADNNDEDIGVRRQGFLSLVPQSIESIHEYQVIALLAPAQVGRNLGAQVNAVSQYGTRNVRGSLYGTFSSHLLNSADYFDTTGGNVTRPLTALAGGAEREVRADGRPLFVTNSAGREDRFAFAQLGGTIGGPLLKSKAAGVKPGQSTAGAGQFGRARDGRGLQLFHFFSFEFQRLRSTKETHFAVPTVEQRGILASGATGLDTDPFSGKPIRAHPTSAQGDAVFSFFPFPNNPDGVYGRNTYTQELPADGLGVVFSGRLDGSREVAGRLHQLIARYNLTDDYRDLPTVGGALFSAVRPDIRSQTFSLFANSFLSPASASAFVSNQLFLSYGRTGFDFEERRDTSFLIPSRLSLRDERERAFLLNARLLENHTLPGSSFVNYVTNTTITADAQLGTPFEPVTAPVGQIVIAGYSPVGADVYTFPQERTNNTYQLSDTVSVQTPRHSFAFGADLRRSELNSRLPRNARPLIRFTGADKTVPTEPGFFPLRRVGSFNATDVAAAGSANEVLQTLTTGDDSTIGLRFYQYNFFARDEWRPRPRLALSFGLRYEYNTPPREAHRRIEGTFDDPLLRVVALEPFINDRTGIFAPDRNNFAPRLGLVYAFGGDDQNIVRLGGGVYYDQAPGVVVSQSRTVVPTFFTFNTAGLYQHLEDRTPIGLGVLLPSTIRISVGCRDDTPLFGIRQPGTLNTVSSATSVGCILQKYLIEDAGGDEVRPVLHTVLPDDDLQMPMAYHYTAAFEREIGRSTVVSAAYVGTQGRHLLRQTTPNLGEHVPVGLFALHVTDVRPAGSGPAEPRPRFGGLTAQPAQRGLDGVAVPRLSPQAGAVRIYESSGNSRYDALQLQVGRRLVNGSTFQFNYTLSKVTDDVSDVFELAGAPALPQNSLTRAGERAVANFDARHVFSGYATYLFPHFGGDARRLKEYLLGGWEVTGKVRLQSGQPFTVNTVRDNNADGNLTDRPNTTEGIVVTGVPRQPLILTVDPQTILARESPDGTRNDGAVGRNTFRAGGRFELDLSFVKNFAFRQSELYDRRLTFRLDVFNLTNRVNFGIPIRHLEAPGFGTAVSTVTPARRLQLSLKFSF